MRRPTQLVAPQQLQTLRESQHTATSRSDIPLLPPSPFPALDGASHPQGTISEAGSPARHAGITRRGRGRPRKAEADKAKNIRYNCTYGCKCKPMTREDLGVHMGNVHQVFPEHDQKRMALVQKCALCHKRFWRGKEFKKHGSRSCQADPDNQLYKVPHPTTMEGCADVWANPKDGPVANRLIAGREHIPGRGDVADDTSVLPAAHAVALPGLLPASPPATPALPLAAAVPVAVPATRAVALPAVALVAADGSAAAIINAGSQPSNSFDSGYLTHSPSGQLPSPTWETLWDGAGLDSPPDSDTISGWVNDYFGQGNA